jgi:hypothetical protein
VGVWVGRGGRPASQHGVDKTHTQHLTPRPLPPHLPGGARPRERWVRLTRSDWADELGLEDEGGGEVGAHEWLLHAAGAVAVAGATCRRLGGRGRLYWCRVPTYPFSVVSECQSWRNALLGLKKGCRCASMRGV